MKKLLGSTLALAMFLPTGANAELLKNLKLSGQLDVSAVSAHNVADLVTRATPEKGTITASNNDRVGHAFSRTMLSADWDLLDDVHARVTLVKGAHNLVAPRSYGEAAETVQGWHDETFVQEANVKIDKLFGLFDTTVGRQFYGEAGDLIVYYGPRDNYGFRTEALDAFRFDWKGEHMMVTGLAARTADSAPATLGAAGSSTDLRGIVVSCNQHEMVKPTAYIYNMQTHATGGSGVGTPNVSGGVLGKNTNLYVAGLKAKITAGGLDAHAEIAKNFGDDRTTFANGGVGPQSGRYTGYALLGKVSYTADIQDVASVKPWGKFGMGSGDANFAHAGNGNFQSINTDFRPGGVYGRFDSGAGVSLAQGVTVGGSGINAASNGLTNRVIYGVGIKATPAAANKLTAGLSFWRYAFHRVAPRANGLKPSRNIGSEVDFTADWKHSDNVSVGATVGQFLPGAYIADMKGAHAALNPARLYAADVKIRF